MWLCLCIVSFVYIATTYLVSYTVYRYCYFYYNIYQFGTGRHTQKANKACKGVYL